MFYQLWWKGTPSYQPHIFLLNVVASLRWLITVDSCAPLRQVGTFLETAHLPLPKANINTYFSTRAKCWIRGGVGG